jgi:hypothetical protein
MGILSECYLFRYPLYKDRTVSVEIKGNNRIGRMPSAAG